MSKQVVNGRAVLKAKRRCEKSPVKGIPYGYTGKMIRFPEELLTEGPCEMPVTTYAFWFPFKDVKDFEKACKSVDRRAYQFLACCVERAEHGGLEGQGIVQYDKELHPVQSTCIGSAEAVLRYAFGSSARFFHQIQDANINNVYGYIKKREVQAGVTTFKRGGFVGIVGYDVEGLWALWSTMKHLTL